MRALFSEEFFQRFHMAYRNYEEGHSLFQFPVLPVSKLVCFDSMFFCCSVAKPSWELEARAWGVGGMLLTSSCNLRCATCNDSRQYSKVLFFIVVGDETLASYVIKVTKSGFE